VHLWKLLHTNDTVFIFRPCTETNCGDSMFSVAHKEPTRSLNTMKYVESLAHISPFVEECFEDFGAMNASFVPFHFEYGTSTVICKVLNFSLLKVGTSEARNVSAHYFASEVSTTVCTKSDVSK
jgi:hypothetical protein